MIVSLYETDFHAWTQRQAELLRAEEFEQIDWHNLIEEIEDLGSSIRREVASRLQLIIMHLLKWQFQPALRSPSWEATIAVQRIDLQEALDKNPSLRARLADFVIDAYPYAVKKAMIETKLPRRTFPETCPYTVEQLLAEEFWP
jgi:predicted RNase H-like nuclease